MEPVIEAVIEALRNRSSMFSMSVCKNNSLNCVDFFVRNGVPEVCPTLDKTVEAKNGRSGSLQICWTCSSPQDGSSFLRALKD
jgi:hypothetical protein